MSASPVLIPAAADDPALASSVTLIRALKSPALASSTKVALAARAWLDPALYVPGKRDALLDWCLADMAPSSSAGSKGKASASGAAASSSESVLINSAATSLSGQLTVLLGLARPPALLSVQHWSLLTSLLGSSSRASTSNGSAAAVAAAHPPPPAALLPLIASFLKALPSSLSGVISPALLDGVTLALDLVLRGGLRVGAEALLDLLGGALASWSACSSSSDGRVDAWAGLFELLAGALEEALLVHLQRKKLASSFLKSDAFPLLVSLLSAASSPSRPHLLHLLSSLALPLESLQSFLQPPPAPASKPKHKASKHILPTQVTAAPSLAITPPSQQQVEQQPLQTALAKLPLPSLLFLLPLLLSDYTALLALHRRVLFPLPSSSASGAPLPPTDVWTAERIALESRRFLQLLSEQLASSASSSPNPQGEGVWRCTRGMWLVIEERGSVGRGYDERDPEWKRLGSTALRAAVAVLDESVDAADTEGGARDEVLGTLTVLLGLDHGLVEPFLPAILARIAVIQSPHGPALAFLAPLLAYHRSTRTLPALVSTLLSTLSSPPSPATSCSAYALVSRGPLLSPAWLVSLTQAMSTALGVQGQLGETLDLVLEALLPLVEVALASASPVTAPASAPEGDDGASRKKKKRKVSLPAPSSSSSSSSSLASAPLALVARLAAHILHATRPLLTSQLPSPLLLGLTAQHRALQVRVAWPLIGKGLEAIGGAEGDAALVAGLRIAGAGVESQVEGEDDEELHRTGELERQKGMMRKLRDDQTGKEAKVELMRYLLDEGEGTGGEELMQDVVDAILPAKDADDVAWSGHLCDLDLEQDERASAAALGVATWALLTTGGAKWLTVFDEVASQAQRDLLSTIIVQSFHPPANNSGLTLSADPSSLSMHSLTSAVFRSPAFFELPSLRSSLLAALSSLTSISSAPLSSSYSFAPGSASSMDLQALRPYELLLALPSAYVPPKQKEELVRRALRLDKAVKLARAPTAGGRSEKDRARAILRAFVASSSTAQDHLVIEEPILDYLIMQAPSDDPSAPYAASLRASTDEILKSAFRHLVKSSASAPDPLAHLVSKLFHPDVQAAFHDSMLDLADTLVPSPSSDAAMDVDGQDEERLATDADLELDFPVQSCQLLLQLIQSELKGPAFLPGADALLPLVSSLHDALDGGVRALSTAGAALLSSPENVQGFAALLGALATTERFLQWAGHVSSSTAPARGLVQSCLKLAPSFTERDLPALAELYAAVLLLHSTESTQTSPSDQFLAEWLCLASALLARECSIDALASSLVAFGKALSSSDRTATLVALSQSLAHTGRPAHLSLAAAHALLVLVKDGSEVSNRAVVSNSLAAIVEVVQSPRSWEIVEVALGVLEVICSDKAAHLTLQDAGLVWTVLVAALSPRATQLSAPSSLPRPSSHPDIFRSLTSSATSLIRHRRDLVASTAPHLLLPLSLLLACLRAPRPNLGGRQLRAILDSSPPWLDLAREPLSPTHARALARLLSSLTAKTVPRRHHHHLSSSTSAPAQKAESLAGPMAKHAPYVLLAYVRLLTDLDVVVPPSARRELEPGLGALCEITGERDRDAVMAGGGLDGGGKGVLKMIWERWEEGKYAGKG